MNRLLVALQFFVILPIYSKSQDVKLLLQQVKSKYDRVNDYTANAKMRTNVIFIKAPVAQIKVYYKKPDKLKIINEKGVSFIPKGTVNINLNNILGLDNYEALASGVEKVNGTLCKVIKIFPLEDNDNIIRATLYIDEQQALINKSVISTRESGTYELLMSYKSYTEYGLPDKVEFAFNTRDYKLPKGISIDYDNGAGRSENDTTKNKKGKVEIIYSNYVINKGVADFLFK